MRCIDCYPDDVPPSACNNPEHWCRFGHGTTLCLNGTHCLNPNHRTDHDPWNEPLHIKRDRFGRYLLPDPHTGEEKPWTRVTTVAGTLDDTFGITDWRLRNAVYGLGLRDDLRDLAASADGPDDKKVLNDVVRQAEAAAASSRKANIGTALHGITQKIDRGDKDVRIPAEHRDRIIRYKTTVAQHRIEWIAEAIERVVVIPELGVAGQIDRIANWTHSPLPIIGDLKTGSIEYAKVKIAQQLGLYSRATHWWDGEEMHPMPEVNQDLALVVHLPAEGDDEPRVYSVNIAEGWRLVQQSMQVRGIRKDKGKHLFTEITAEAIPTPSANREEALRTRVKRIVAAGHTAALKGLWDPSVPTLKEGGLTDTDLDLVEFWCEKVETEKGL